MNTTILVTDMRDIKHNGMILGVHYRKTKTGYQGMIDVKYQTGPADNYRIPCDTQNHTHQTNALADAIALRKSLIAMDTLGKTP